MAELDEATRKVIERAAKIYQLAQKNPNEAEAAAAAAKFQELLAEHNLDMAAIEQASGGKAQRSDENTPGGLYKFQRDLWLHVADLNFCIYWNDYVYDPNKKRRKRNSWGGSRVVMGGYRFQHRLVGRKVNVIATKTTAEYLEAAIERLARERMGDPKEYFTEYAIAFREGVAERVIRAINERRRVRIREEAEEQRQREQVAADAAMAGASTATAITIASFSKSERDANIDFVYGDGTAAKWAAERAAAAAEAKAEAERHTKWAAEHPEEAAAEEEARLKARRKSSWNAGTGEGSKANRRRASSAFKEGFEKGDRISIDPQMEQSRKIGR